MFWSLRSWMDNADLFGWKALEFGAKKLYNVELVSIMALSAKRSTPVEVRREGSRWSVLSSAAIHYTKTWPLQVRERLSRLQCHSSFICLTLFPSTIVCTVKVISA